MKTKLINLIVFLFIFNLSFAQSKNEKQLTDDQNYERNLCVSGGKMVWYQDSASFRNLIYWDGLKKIKLVNEKNLKADKSYPKISGNYIVWAQHDGNDYEIMLYDGTNINQITNNNFDDIRPDLHNNRIVWQAVNNSKNEVYYYNGSSTVKLNSDTISAYFPRISKNKIAWLAQNANGNGIFIYEDGQTKLISDFSSNDKFEPFTSDSIVAWIGYNGTKYEIYTYKTITKPLNVVYDDFTIVDTYNDNILLKVVDPGKNKDVCLYDGTFNMITNDGQSYAGSIHGDTILYESAGKIYLYTKTLGIQTITQNGNDYDPIYKGGVIAWTRDVAVNNEVFIFEDVVIVPPTLSNISIDGITSNSALAHITYNESGTIYYAVLPSSSTVPTVNDIKAGVNFIFAGNNSITADNTIDINISGLSASSSYSLYSLAVDIANNNSSVNKADFSTIVNTINNDNAGTLFRVYPNPASNGFINIFSKEETIYKIINTTGSTVKKGKVLEGVTNIDISNLANGIYYVQVIVGDIPITRKLVIN